MKLLPCPFCGHKEPSIVRYGDARKSTQYECGMCSCTLETPEEWDHGRWWNQRWKQPEDKVQVKFSVEELKDLRDAIELKRTKLKENSTEYKGSVKKILNEKLDQLEAFHQRLVGIVVAAEEQEKNQDDDTDD